MAKVIMQFGGHDIEGDAATLSDINNKLTQHEILLAALRGMMNVYDKDPDDAAGWIVRARAAIAATEVSVMKCDQCEMISVNGVACHETGCPNSNARWDADSGSWVQQRECFECGCTVDRYDPCCAYVEDRPDVNAEWEV